MGVRPRGDGDNAISLALPNGSRIVGGAGEFVADEHAIRKAWIFLGELGAGRAGVRVWERTEHG